MSNSYARQTRQGTMVKRRSVLLGAASGVTAVAVAASPASAVSSSRVSTHRIDVREFPDLQNAIDAHVPLLIAKGQTIDYEARNVLIDSGTDLQVDGVLRKVGDANGGGTTGSFIRNRDFATKVNDVKIHGSGVIRAIDHTKTGNLFGISGDRLLLEKFRITCWAGGRAMVLDGDDIVARYLSISGSPASSGNGGIRVVGGKRFQGVGCNVVSGDDALQFVPSGARADPLYDRSISGGRYIGCTGRSTAARFVVVAIQHADLSDPTIDMTCSVTDVGFSDINGIGGVAAMVLQNLHSSGTINGVVASGVIDMGPSTAPVLGQEVLVTGRSGSGGVRNVSSAQLTILNPRTRVARISGVTSNIKMRARANGYQVSDRGRISADVQDALNAAK